MPPIGNMVCLLENLPENVPIYRPDSCRFITIDEPCAVRENDENVRRVMD